MAPEHFREVGNEEKKSCKPTNLLSLTIKKNDSNHRGQQRKFENNYLEFEVFYINMFNIYTYIYIKEI